MRGKTKNQGLFWTRTKARGYLFLFVALSCYVFLVTPFSTYMQNKPFVEKIGNMPSIKLIQFGAADQKTLVGELLILKVIMYFGGLMEENKAEYIIPPDYPAMSRVLHAAVKLDPYNMDAYYFGQSILVWDVGQIQLANNLLDYGMKYRTWDWYLPFFAGFNHAYFLKDFKQAAKYYRLAGALSGSPLFSNLASRYMQESGQTDLALVYLSTMSKNAKNAAVKQVFDTRLAALTAVKKIESASAAFQHDLGRQAKSIAGLIDRGYLAKIPNDPYGGEFYLAPDGQVKTTSNFAFAKKIKKN
ncbi:hypothetical protein [Geopsychrobacter electrodiphilus]|uniref:hypothetical protein n=1 Tax=Geopsychrobacter electrodiphilus TaxID=225196 RepID=UPI0006854137|nr:hypothetical protein [Geopsychrobacter electrodiphilus]